MATPTSREQLLLELINRARLDPLAEAERYGIGLNDNLPAGTISSDIKAPLAMNEFLVDSARAHSQWMLDNDIFSHTGVGGSDAGQRMADAGYVFSGSSSWGENIAWTGSTGSIDATWAIYFLHERLFLSAGHRTNILGTDFIEFGGGQQAGQFTANGTAWNASMLTENFAYTSDRTNFLTGVVFRDTDNDDFYSVGEGQGNITVTIAGGDSTATYSAGGYSIGDVSGTFSVTFAGATLAEPVSATLTSAGGNVKLDLMADDSILRSSVNVTLGAGATGLVLLGDAVSGTGNDQDNTLVGNRYSNILTGGSGNDTFRFLRAVDSTSTATDTIGDFQAGDTIEYVGMNGIQLLSDAYTWVGSLSATLGAVSSDTSIGNAVVFFTDGTDGWLTVKGSGSGTNFSGSLIHLDDWSTMLTLDDLLGPSSVLAVVPTIENVSLAANADPDRTCVAGDEILVQVRFSEDVLVDTGSGVPTLALRVGTTIRQAYYAGGSGGSILTFACTVQAGDVDVDGVSIAANALALNGGTIADLTGNAAQLSHGALANSADHKVETTVPRITTAILSASAGLDKTWTVGENVQVTVNFSEKVDVDTSSGTPFVNLRLGDTTRQAAFIGGSGTTALIFRYTVQEGESDIDGISLGADALDANGGAIRDLAGNAALLTHVALQDNASHKVDGIRPTVTSFAANTPDGGYNAGDRIVLTAIMSEKVLAGATIKVQLDTGDMVSLLAAATGTALTGSYTVGAGDTSPDLTVQSIIAATVKDPAGNLFTDLSLPAGENLADNKNLLIDTTAPQLTNLAFSSSAGGDRTYEAKDQIQITATFDDAVFVKGTPLVNLKVGGTIRQARYLGGSGTNSLTFAYTVQPGEVDSGGVSLAANAFSLVTGSIRDGVGNNALLTHTALNDDPDHGVNGTAPVVTAFSSGTVNGWYNAGDKITLTAILSEKVRAGSSIDVTLSTGVVVRLTTLAAATTLTGSYPVGTGDTGPDLTVTSYAPVGTLLDLAGQPLTDTRLPVGKNLGDSKNLVIDTTTPTITELTFLSDPGADATYKAGDTVRLAVSFSEQVLVKGVPLLALNLGGTTVQARYSSGTGTDTLVFSLIVPAGAGDNDGISVDADALSLPILASIRDRAGNNAVLGHDVLTPSPEHMVDAIAPRLTSLALASDAGPDQIYVVGEQIRVTVSFDEKVAVSGAPLVNLKLGGIIRQATYLSGSGTETLTFAYSVRPGDSDANGIAIAANSLNLNGGAIRDLAGNNAVLTYSALVDEANHKVDGSAPRVTGLSLVSNAGLDKTYDAGDVIRVQVKFGEVVSVDTASGSPTLALKVGNTLRQAIYSGGTGSAILTFDYTVQAGDTDIDGLSVNANGLVLNGGTIRDAIGNNALLTHLALGNNAGHKVDAAAPLVTAFSASTVNGRYNAGDKITLTASLSEKVQAGAAIDVTLDTGAVVRLFSAVVGSTLSGIYTIPAGHNSLDLNVVSYASVGPIQDPVGHLLTDTTLPAGKNLADSKNLVVDTIAPKVIAFSATTSNGWYRTGEKIGLNATMSETVQAGATVNVTLDTGDVVILKAATAGTLLSGIYTAGAGDESPDLNVTGFTATLVKDLAGNPLVDTSLPAGANLADNKALVLDSDIFIRISDTTVIEGGKAQFIITLQNGGGKPVTAVSDIAVQYLIAAGTATDADYVGGTGGSLIIKTGQSSGVITMDTIEDGALEDVENLTLTLQSVSGAGAVLDAANSTAFDNIVDNENGVGRWFGTGGDDSYSSQGAGELLFAGAGNDTLIGSSGADILLGEDGADQLTGGGGDDRLFGGGGYDNYFYTAGADLASGDGNDTIDESVGMLHGGGIDTLTIGGVGSLFENANDTWDMRFRLSDDRHDLLINLTPAADDPADPSVGQITIRHMDDATFRLETLVLGDTGEQVSLLAVYNTLATLSSTPTDWTVLQTSGTNTDNGGLGKSVTLVA